MRIVRHAGAEPARHLGRDLDSGQPPADDQHRVPFDRPWLTGQPSEVRAEQRGGLVRVDIEGVLSQPRNRRADQSAAEGEDHAIVRELGRSVRRGVSDGPFSDTETGDLRHHEAYADWLENIHERHAGTAQLGFVVTHSDGVPRRSVHNDDLDPVRAYSAFVERPGGPDCRPKTGETCAKNDDPLHAAPPGICVCSW